MSHSLIKKDVGQIDVSKAVEHEVMHGDLFKLNRKGQWQKRWFRLTDEHLSYYTNAKATTPKATIDLKDCHGIEKLRNGERYTFGLVRNDTEPYWLKATGDDLIIHSQMKKWIDELKKRMDIPADKKIPAAGAKKKRVKRDSLVVTKERKKKNAGKAKEQAPAGMKVEIVDENDDNSSSSNNNNNNSTNNNNNNTEESQSNNLITDSTLRSEVQLTTAMSTRVVEPQVIAIAIEDNKDAFRDNNYNNNSKKNNNQTNDIDDEEEKPVEPKKKSGSFVCCK